MRKKKAEKARLPLPVLKRQPNGDFQLQTCERGGAATSNLEEVTEIEKEAIEALLLLSRSRTTKLIERVGGRLAKQGKRKRTRVEDHIGGVGWRRRQRRPTEEKEEANGEHSGEVRVCGTSFETVERMGGRILLRYEPLLSAGTAEARAPLMRRLVPVAPSSTVVVSVGAESRAVLRLLSQRDSGA